MLIVGHHNGYPIKRFLIQFDTSGGPNMEIESAEMQLWFLYAHRASWNIEGVFTTAVPLSPLPPSNTTNKRMKSNKHEYTWTNMNECV